jgi:hypothetical protein
MESTNGDGRTVAFRRMASWAAGDLYVLALSVGGRAVGEPRRVTFINRWLSNPVWAADGRSLLFVSGSDRRGLYRVRLSGASDPTTLVPLTGQDGAALAISYVARRLAYSRAEVDDNIWRLDNWRAGGGAPTTNSSSTPMQPFISSTWEDATPQYSPDGTKIAFQSKRSGSAEVWVCDADGSNCFQLTFMHSNICGFPHWSPDGTKIVFHSRPKAKAEIFLVHLSGGAPRQLTDDGADNIAPSWPRDGKWIYFGSRGRGGQVWKIRSEGGTPVQVTRQGGLIAEESTDGRFLFYAKHLDADHRSGATLWQMPAAGGEETLVGSLANASTFAPGNNGVYFIAADPRTANYILQFRGTDHSATRKLIGIDAALSAGMSVSPDQHWILYVPVDKTAGDLMMLESFP